MCSIALISEHLTKFFLFFKLVHFNYSLRFLAYMLTSEGIRPDPDKVSATEGMTPPPPQKKKPPKKQKPKPKKRKNKKHSWK